MKLDPEISRVLDAAPYAHLATLLPDGGPHSVTVWIASHGDRIAVITGPDSVKARNVRRDPRVAISLTPPDSPFPPIAVRGRVVEWIDGEAGWKVVDEISTKYTGAPYPRDAERIVLVIEVDWQKVGL